MKTHKSDTLYDIVEYVKRIFPVPPRCHLFRTARQDYAYDTNTGEIITCDIVSINIIKHLGKPDFGESVHELIQKHGDELVADSLTQLVKLSADREPPLFSTRGPTEIRYYLGFHEFKELLEHKLESVVVSLTNNCNMACRYCIYSGEHTARATHGSDVMSKETLQSTLEYFVEHSTETELPHFGFYGGEPTLTPELIRYVADYLTEKFGNRRYTVGVASNFFNVSNEMLSLFRDRDFLVYVSLDGPQHIHDKWRIRPDGSGTFAQVMKNMRRLKELDPDWYSQKVSIVSTMTPPFNLYDLRNFFENEDLIPSGNNALRFNFVESEESSAPDWTPEPSQMKSYMQMRQEYLNKARLGKLSDWEGNRFIKSLFDQEFLNIYRRHRNKKSFPDSTFPGGICVPGKRKIYVQSDGTFLLCERVPEFKPFVIGNCQTGIDSSKAYQLCQEFAEISAGECAQCWAVCLCDSICFRDAFNDDGPSPQIKHAACKVLRNHKSQLLSEMCSVLEENPKAFDYMDSITVR